MVRMALIWSVEIPASVRAGAFILFLFCSKRFLSTDKRIPDC